MTRAADTVPISPAALTPPTIPLIDLADQSHRQVVVDREPGVYLGHPTTVLLEDGATMLAVYPMNHGHGQILLKRSVDGGRTWSQRLPTPANWLTSQETPTLYRTVDRRGTRRLILFSGRFPVRLSVSEDDGRTWTPLAPIGDFGGTVAMSDLVRLRSGDTMALFHECSYRLQPVSKPCVACGQPATLTCGVCCWTTEESNYCAACAAKHGCEPRGLMPVDYTPCVRPHIPRQGVFKTLSSDGGLTWSRPEFVTSHPQGFLCEPGAVRSPDGQRLAVLLRENHRRFNSFIIFSDDEGATWSEPRELPTALTGDRHQARYAPDGRLFITFRERALYGSPTHGDWCAWVGTWDDLATGREGQYRVRLMDNQISDQDRDWDCGYPGVEVLPDGTIVTTTYGHWQARQKPYIVSVRLKLGELDEQAKQADA
jgi:hypothetical protein